MLKSKDAKYKILSMMFYGNLPDLKIRWHGQDAIRLQCNFLMEHGTSSPPILFILWHVYLNNRSENVSVL